MDESKKLYINHSLPLPQLLPLTSMTTAAFKEKLDLSVYKNLLYSAVSNECWNSAT